jgi:hypothetical protein
MSDTIPYDHPLPPVVINPPQGVEADSAFVFMHGLGDEGSR